jgi:hypothetical protein
MTSPYVEVQSLSEWEGMNAGKKRNSVSDAHMH